MRHTTFGRRTGLRVSECALGTANFGTGWGGGADLGEARRILDRYADLGGTFLDTADCYQHGQAETMLGELLKGRRDAFVLGSKSGYGVGPSPHVQATGNGAKAITRALEASLLRLGTDYLDIYWVHFPDSVTPIEEVIYVLEGLVRSGKVLHIGLSNFPAWRVSRAATIAELRGWAPIVAIQTEYSLVERTAERELLPMASSLGLGVAGWSPLGGGLLTAKYRRSEEGRLTDWQRKAIRVEDSPQRTKILDAVLEIAAQHAYSPVQVALAWTIAHARRQQTSFVPVLGPRTVAQLEECVTSLATPLDEECLARLDAVSAMPMGSPHDVSAAAIGRLLGGEETGVSLRGAAVA